MTYDASAAADASASGLATGLAIGEMRRQEEESKGRRKSHIGIDQILLESNKHIDIIGKNIAGLYSDWYYKSDDNKIYKTNNCKISWEESILTFFLIGGIMISWVILPSLICDWNRDCIMGYPLDFIQSIILSIVLSMAVGLFIPKFDYDVDYIRLTNVSKNHTRILLKVYDNNGYRNLDEDEIMKISDLI